MLSTIAGTGTLFAIVCFIAFIKFFGDSPKSNLDIQANQPAAAEVGKNGELNSEAPPVADSTSEKTAGPVHEVIGQTAETGTKEPTHAPSTIESAAGNSSQSIEPQVASNAPNRESNNVSPTANSKVDGNPSQVSPSADPDKEFAELFTQDLFKPILNGNRPSTANLGTTQTTDDLDVQNAMVDIGNVYHPLPKTVPNWEDRSKLQFTSIRMQDASLLRCIDWFGRTTGVGITLDWQSLRAAGIDPSQKISFESQRKTAGEILGEIINTHHLEWSISPQGLPVVRAPNAVIDSRMPKDWSVTQYVTTNNEAELCQQLLRLWGAESFCAYRNGSLNWTEQANPIDKANVLTSLLILAHLQNRTHAVPPDFQELFSPSLWQACFDRLKKTVRKSTIAPDARPIPELLMTAASDIQVNLFIDWQHVWGHGLAPDEMAVMYLPGRTLPQISTRFLNNFGLELVPIASDSVWLTTADVRRKMIRVLPIRLSADMKFDDLKQSLLPLAPLGPDENSRYRLEPISGVPEFYWARICTPRTDQASDFNLIQTFGWPKE